MNLDEFFAALEKTPRGWVIQRWVHRGGIRRKGAFASQCPLTAVAGFGEYRNVWTYAGPSYWRDAAREIGLKEADARKIINGSDGRGKLRGRLLAACGIEETTG